eukprot:scaffold119440_cov60-Phaeocystis_antarctica.AAC.1
MVAAAMLAVSKVETAAGRGTRRSSRYNRTPSQWRQSPRTLAPRAFKDLRGLWSAVRPSKRRLALGLKRERAAGEWGAPSTVDAGHFQQVVAPVQTRELSAVGVCAARVGACGRRRHRRW